MRTFGKIIVEVPSTGEKVLFLLGPDGKSVSVTHSNGLMYIDLYDTEANAAAYMESVNDHFMKDEKTEVLSYGPT